MSLRHDQLTVGEIPYYFASKFDTKDKVAVKTNEGFELTFTQLNNRSNQVARLMIEDFQLKQGDTVVTFLTNCGQYPEIIFGLAKAGIIIAPVSFRFVSRELKYAIEHSDTKALILSEELWDIYREIEHEVQIPKDNVLIIGNGAMANYESRIKKKDYKNFDVYVHENDNFWLGLTGGTTGAPKAALTTHRSMIEHWKRVAIEFTMLPDDFLLISSPFYHGLGFLFGLQLLSVGGSLYITKTFNPKLILSIIEEEKITVTPVVPTMLSEILNDSDKDNYDVSSLRVLICGGAALLTKLKEDTLQFFPKCGLYTMYSSTEHGFYTLLKPKDQLRKNRSSGLPFYGVNIKILDENGNEVKQGEVGEVYKKGLLLGAEYYKNLEETRKCFRGEWASSGDMGYVDEEGFLYIVDRKKDMIISGGVNIYPTEIEEIILTHPSVREVCVVGLPNEKWGEIVSAFIVGKDGSTFSSEDILRHCDGKMGNYKKPKYIRFINELPKNAAGKILRRSLKDIYADPNLIV
ncbi:acyl--CoA ligase [Bacillus sp. FJAT-29953]|nr:acyl--CoA ligase [Bacillus sp. FJAT-29953]